MDSQLNSPQRAAVRYLDGPLLVLAGAGSGKTRVITQKIAYLIQQAGYAPQHIAAVTFTNKAAREMKSRVGKLLQGGQSKGLVVSTFHTLGLNLLRKEAGVLGYKSGFSIFDAQDSISLLRTLSEQEQAVDADKVNAIQAQISRWKNALCSPQQALSEAQDDAQAYAARLFIAYQRQLLAYNAVDFDDLIVQPVYLLREHPARLLHWQGKIRYLLVDEYQDTNRAQYQLIKLLTAIRGAFTVVGDDDQSIYAWRGAEPENLHLLQQDYPRLKVIKLEQNYRSAGNILDLANGLIGHNPHLFEKKLWSAKGPGDLIRVLTTRDETHEAERVVSELLHHKFQSGGTFCDYAILYRSNYQSRLFERVLRSMRIPYFLSGGTSFFERTEVKDIMSYLRLLVNPDDDAAFVRVVNTPKREIGATTLEKLGNYARLRNLSLFAASFELGLQQYLSGAPLERLQRFTHWLVDRGDLAQRGDPVALVREVVAEIDYDAWLKDQSNDLKTAERRMANVQELLTWLQTLRDKDLEQDKSLADMVAHLTLLDILDRQDEDQRADRVALMTLHAAKGLEFPHVFLVGMEEEILPHANSLEEPALLEERRLAYVGITRACKTLTCSLTTSRTRYGERKTCQPSRFLQELPQQFLRWEGAKPADPEQQKQKGQAHLANLRQMLNAKN